MNKHRKKRVASFEERAAFDPEMVYHHPTGGWRYIPVHFYADETEDDVWTADCWCHLGEDAALMECIVAKHSRLEPGLYARVDAHSPFWPKLHAILPAPLTRPAVETAMQGFVELGFPDPLLLKLSPGDPPVRLTP